MQRLVPWDPPWVLWDYLESASWNVFKTQSSWSSRVWRIPSYQFELWKISGHLQELPNRCAILLPFCSLCIIFNLDLKTLSPNFQSKRFHTMQKKGREKEESMSVGRLNVCMFFPKVAEPSGECKALLNYKTNISADSGFLHFAIFICSVWYLTNLIKTIQA